MIDAIQSILKRQNILSHGNQGILIANVSDSKRGLALANDLLTQIVQSSVVYLSGGRTPKDLYKKLAEKEAFAPGAVGLIDERYGPKWHESSNEKMIRDTGLLRYLQMRDIPFYPILTGNGSREETAEAYDAKVRELHSTYQKSIGILGVGMDGHTAGIAGNRDDFTNPMFESSRKHLMVSEFDDKKGMYKERVSMTFLGLSMLDLLLVLVFDDDKKDALDKMFFDGKEEDVPSRFFKRPEIAAKTVIITDQNI